ncbi:hypothetical protein CDL15_Pgr027366 [Punica granatum]|uniref:Aminotransferase-like plant mobile domain-containing protein n=1 Tax=Punica granatum TaxID=22663 RepID=A0A218Y211_PUNGR|nr:hypothetical protein CDL15_Pgr027366 [Punica granatum]
MPHLVSCPRLDRVMPPLEEIARIWTVLRLVDRHYIVAFVGDIPLLATQRVDWNFLEAAIAFWNTSHVVFDIHGTKLTPTIEEYRILIGRPAVIHGIVEPNFHATRPTLVSPLLKHSESPEKQKKALKPKSTSQLAEQPLAPAPHLVLLTPKEVSKMIEECFAEMERKRIGLPAFNSNVTLPLSREISGTRLLPRLSFPQIAAYDGKSDPHDHVRRHVTSLLGTTMADNAISL